MSDIIKYCIRCKITKDIKDFCIDNTRKDKHHPYCKLCLNKINKKSYKVYRNKNKDKLTQHMRVYRSSSPLIRLKESLRTRTNTIMKQLWAKDNLSKGARNCQI